MSDTTSGEYDQIVVALAHRSLVQGTLADWGVEIQAAQEAPELGLGLLDLRPDQVREATLSEREQTLDGLLTRLYRFFAGQYGGWVPTIGKNRDVEAVIANHTIGGGRPAGQGGGMPAVVNHTIGGGGEGMPALVATSSWPLRPATDGRGVTVAVADTRVAPRPELLGRLVADRDSLLLDSASSYDADAGHGTFVSGLVLREAPGATLAVTAVLDDKGGSDSWSVARSIVGLARSGASVLNLSLGCFTADNQPPLVLSTAIDRLDASLLIVAAAGNHALTYPKRPLWPAALDDVVAVGSTDASGNNLSPWSPVPWDNPWVDVLACGQDVESLYLQGAVDTYDRESGRGDKQTMFSGYARWSGTSFAAARASGMVATACHGRPGSAADALRALVDRAPRQHGLPWLG